jgi:hypothetical protein
LLVLLVQHGQHLLGLVVARPVAGWHRRQGKWLSSGCLELGTSQDLRLKRLQLRFAQRFATRRGKYWSCCKLLIAITCENVFVAGRSD